MIKTIKKGYYKTGVAMMMGVMMLPLDAAFAGTRNAGTVISPTAVAGNSYNTIAANITGSIANLPGLVTALSYLAGITLGTLGIFKIKDHVENPSQTPLKEGAIRLGAGGALLGLPIVFESMQNSVGLGTAPTVDAVSAVKMTTLP